MGHYAELTNKLSGIMVREDEGPLEMLTDLGADCFAKAKVGVLGWKPSASGRATCGGTIEACARKIGIRLVHYFGFDDFD